MTSAPSSMSVFELLKAGPGPSSSHTIGPMKAGADFASLVQGLPADSLNRAAGVRVRLWGSLSATGKGHGTDRAVIAGLMGYEPERCPPALLNDLENIPPADRVLKLNDRTLPLGFDIINYGPIHHRRPYSNTLFIDLLDRPWPADFSVSASIPPLSERDLPPDPLSPNIIFSREYYSVGGGFIQWAGWEPEVRGQVPYPYQNTRDLMVQLAESSLTLDRLMLANESALTGLDESTVNQELDHLLALMKDAVKRGRSTRGRLPGSIGLYRKAPALYDKAGQLADFDRGLALLNAYAYGAAEENAAGNIIVTAPTCGSAGVMPALIVFMEEQLGLSLKAQRGASWPPRPLVSLPSKTPESPEPRSAARVKSGWPRPWPPPCWLTAGAARLRLW